MSSALYRVREPFSDAPSALARARAIMRDLADWSGLPWARLEPVTTREQYEHAVRTFSTGRVGGERDLPGLDAYLGELAARDVALDRLEPHPVFVADLQLRPDLADLWPLPDGLSFFLNATPPFGTPDSEPEDDSTEEDLSRMAGLLGPLTLDVRWDCAWRGLSESKDCGVLLCMNSVWVSQHVEPSPDEFGVWISLGPRVAATSEAEEWLRDCGLPLDEPQEGW
jgi:hypothetical protein